eukprot:g13331.t1
MSAAPPSSAGPALVLPDGGRPPPTELSHEEVAEFLDFFDREEIDGLRQIYGECDEGGKGFLTGSEFHKALTEIPKEEISHFPGHWSCGGRLVLPLVAMIQLEGVPNSPTQDACRRLHTKVVRSQNGEGGMDFAFFLRVLQTIHQEDTYSVLDAISVASSDDFLDHPSVEVPSVEVLKEVSKPRAEGEAKGDDVDEQEDSGAVYEDGEDSGAVYEDGGGGGDDVGEVDETSEEEDGDDGPNDEQQGGDEEQQADKKEEENAAADVEEDEEDGASSSNSSSSQSEAASPEDAAKVEVEDDATGAASPSSPRDLAFDAGSSSKNLSVGGAAPDNDAHDHPPASTHNIDSLLLDRRDLVERPPTTTEKVHLASTGLPQTSSSEELRELSSSAVSLLENESRMKKQLQLCNRETYVPVVVPPSRTTRKFGDGLSLFARRASKLQSAAVSLDHALDAARRARVRAEHEAAREALNASELRVKFEATVLQHKEELKSVQQSVGKLDAAAALSVQTQVRAAEMAEREKLEKEYAEKLQGRNEALRKAKSERDELGKEVGRLKEQLEIEGENFAGQMRDMRVGIEELQTRLRDSEEKRDEWERQNLRLEEEKDVLAGACDEGQRILDEKEAEMQRLREEIMSGRPRGNDNLEEAAIARELKDEMQNRYFEMERELNQMKRRVRDTGEDDEDFVRGAGTEDSLAAGEADVQGGVRKMAGPGRSMNNKAMRMDTDYNLPPSWFKKLRKVVL